MTIVLLHGFCEDHTIWNAMIPFSKFKDSILCLDLPGFGDNSNELASAPSVELMAAFVKQELQKRNIEQCVIVGHSLGGYVALAFAELYPEMLAGFGLLHSTALPDNEERKAARLKTMEFVKANGAEAFHRVLIPGLFQTTTDAALVEHTIAAAKTAKADGIIAALEAMRKREGRYSVYVNFTKPVLFIAGEHDALIPKDSMIAQAALCKKSMIEVLSGSAHMGQLEEPQNCAKIIDNFIIFCTQ